LSDGHGHDWLFGLQRGHRGPDCGDGDRHIRRRKKSVAGIWRDNATPGVLQCGAPALSSPCFSDDHLGRAFMSVAEYDAAIAGAIDETASPPMSNATDCS
jgi:hypothetical protein